MNGLRRVDGKKSSDNEENFTPVEIEIAHAGTSIPAGEYRAYCRHARTYFDGGFKRWTCLLDFDVFSDRLMLIAKLPLWFNLGAGKKPRVTRRSNYLAAWIKANGGPPRRVDRLTARVFLRRMCRVTVASTVGAFPRSVVRKILEWQTGPSSALASVEGSFQPKTTQPAGAVLNAPAKACSIGGISE